ncbi:MAG TPA: nucleotidyltransferase family protein [Bacteroidales bacterium]|jgi:D-glycero-alpha-D-manno-heptose 1-phosphate guanylyltransferase|nr:nucleotidyltransferase family protein [Bacteroidales bacterium]HQH25380.1 nucleotidyltransferase family protein [Bacteroidales bacterium]HQJ82952.1 nucleotidyltransferase family protein [Bacteroidales bacterium]
MEVIILAGGLGTRLREVIRDIPKPMAPVAGRPFLHYILDWLRRYPVRKIIISAGYRAEVIREHFGSRFYEIPLEYVIEEKPLGTGGAVNYALGKTAGNDILVLNGDTWFPVDPCRLMGFHSSEDSRFSLALKRMFDFDRYGTVSLEGNRVLGFNEKKACDEGLINGGIYVINRKFFESQKMPEVFSLEKDFLEKNAGKSVLKGMIFGDPFLDIGIPEDYAKAEEVLGKYFQK